MAKKCVANGGRCAAMNGGRSVVRMAEGEERIAKCER